MLWLHRNACLCSHKVLMPYELIIILCMIATNTVLTQVSESPVFILKSLVSNTKHAVVNILPLQHFTTHGMYYSSVLACCGSKSVLQYFAIIELSKFALQLFLSGTVYGKKDFIS